MSNWTTYKLAELCSKIGSGATPRGGKSAYISEGISLIRSQNVLDFTFTEDGLAFINEAQAKALANVDVQDRDVLVNITGDSVARVCQVPNKYLPARVNQHVAILRADTSKLSPEFLKYSLLTKFNKDKLLSLASTGATRNALTKGMLEEFEISVPEDVIIQNRIAEILSALDDKIELNRRMNQTLEQMAQTLFRQYFMNGIDEENLPVGWSKETLENQIEVARGLSYKGSGLCSKGEGIPMHNLNSIYEGGGYKYEGIKYYKGDFKERHGVKPWDIIVSNTEQGHKYLLIGYPSVVPHSFGSQGIFSQHLYRVRPKQNSYLTSQYIYYLIMSPSLRDQIVACTNGTTVNMLALDGMQKPEFCMPPKDLVERFSKLVSSIWKKKEALHLESEKLTQLRNTLLPKLMSGEIDVMQTQPEALHEPILS